MLNSNIPAQVVEYLAVDMGAMGDDQQTDEYTVSICVKDASGPYHYTSVNTWLLGESTRYSI